MIEMVSSQDYISSILVENFDNKSTIEQKLKTLNALKVFFCKKCGIKPENVKYINKSLNNSDSILEVKEFDGEDFYFINIDNTYFAKSTISGFIATISHEWGHIYYYEKEKSGEIMLEGVDIDESKELLLPLWQKIGVKYKYEACEDEYMATMFAINHLKLWLNNARKLSLDQNVIKTRLSCVNRAEIKTKTAMNLAKVKYKMWKKISTILNIEEESAMFSDVPNGLTEEEFIYNNNLQVFEEFGKATKDELETTIFKIEHKAKTREKRCAATIKTNQKRVNEKLFLTDCYINLLAINSGLKQEELGIKLCENNEILEFVPSRKNNSNSPLYGCVNLSVRNMAELSTCEYAAILNKFIINVQKQIEADKKEPAMEN